MLWSLAFIISASLLGLGLLVYCFQERMIFFPFRQLELHPGDLSLPVADVAIPTADGLQLHGWLIPAATPRRGTVLFCHGNAGNISHCLDVATDYRDLGLDVLLFDYRGYGQSPGRPSETGIYRDAEAAWRWLTVTQGIPPDEIIVVGRSLGGAPAAYLAGSVAPGPRAVILESVFASVPDIARVHYPFLPSWLARLDLPTVKFVAAIRCPVLVLHSPDDEIVPFAQGRRVFAAANPPKDFGELRGDHNHCYQLDADNYRRRLAVFLDAHLPPPPEK